MAHPRSRELFRRWLLALGCFAVLIFCFSPPWNSFLVWSRVPEMGWLIELRRGVCVLEQIARPGAELTDPIHRPIQWRLLFPLIGRTLSLPPGPFFALAHAGCFLVLGYVITLLRRHNTGWRETTLATLVAGSASWFFTSTGWLGYFDSWLALSLLFVAFASHRWPMWLACLWAPWVDERFVIALPLALGCRHLAASLALAPRALAPAANTRNVAHPGLVRRPSFSWMLDVGVPAALTAGFIVVRLVLLAERSSPLATVGGYLAHQQYLDAPPSRIALGLWAGLRAGWFFVAAAVLLLWRHRTGATVASPFASLPTRAASRLLALLLVAGVLLTGMIGMATAQDYSRSMTMLLPVVVLGLLILVPAAQSRRLLPGAAAVALLLPAHHVVNDRVHPIYYLYHELGALHSPPLQTTSEFFELNAVRELDQGDVAQAHLDLTIAIKLAENPASPAMRRGVLAANHDHWAAAFEDFSTMVEHDPTNPEAWFLRARAHLELGRTREARVDCNQALALAPAGWALREDVTSFMQQLNQAP